MDLFVQVAIAQADAGAPTGDLTLYDRCTVDQVVQNDSHGLTHVLTGHQAPGLRAFGVHLHDNLHIPGHAIILVGIDDGATVQARFSATWHFQRVERKEL